MGSRSATVISKIEITRTPSGWKMRLHLDEPRRHEEQEFAYQNYPAMLNWLTMRLEADAQNLTQWPEEQGPPSDA